MNTTHSQRLAAADIAYNLTVTVEQAQRMIQKVWERWFSAADQKSIEAWDAEEIGDILNSISNMLFYTRREFELDTGADSVFPEVEHYLEAARSHITYNRVSTLNDAVWKAEKEIKDTEAREAYSNQRKAACYLPDEQAIETLEALLRKGASV